MAEPIVLYGYEASPYTLKIKDYLTLKHIPYFYCPQPKVLPRPDLAKLGINYRRIPVLSSGREIYADTNCIIAALEKKYPSPSLFANDATAESTYASHKALSKFGDVSIS